jgi:hypothetical protein
MVEIDRMKSEVTILERYALRWSVLAAWVDEMRGRKIAVPSDLDQKFEKARVELASGCFSSCQVGEELGYIEGVLVSTDASSESGNVDFWLELMGRAMEDKSAIEKLLKVPAVKFKLSGCGVNCRCGI